MISAAFDEWRAPLVRFCAQLLRNRHDAEEVVQDVFARLLAKPGRYDLETAPEVLLFRAARNGCIDLRRKHSARSNSLDEDPAVVQEPAAAQETDRDTNHEELAAALQELPAQERETLLLTAVDGLGYREVADILGCSLGTVATRRGTAIHKLRKRLMP